MTRLALLPLVLAGCGGAASAIPAGQDIANTDLALDLGALTGTATLTVHPDDDAVVLDVAGLDVSAVSVDGASERVRVKDGLLTVPASGETVTVGVDYGFPARTQAEFDGWMPDLGVSFIWPNYCSNLFPCNPDLADGLTFTADISGVGDGLTAVYPKTTVGDGPTYMMGVSVGDYTRMDLGTTTAGTTVAAFYLPADDAVARTTRGTSHLVASYDYFEQTYGPYHFGPEAGTVEVNWGEDSWGGMEHHPYVHVGTFDFDDEEAQVHEAGHAWFGDGVRLGCWEDFVLSEGTTTYIAARALEQVDGPNEWPYYVDDFLTPICEGTMPNDPTMQNAMVLPDDTCNAIDFENDPIWSLTTYMKGACFYEEVADLIGADQLDAIIGEFYTAHVGGTARMQDMIDLIEARADASKHDAIEAAAQDWLRSLDCPSDYAQRCKNHGT